MARAKLHEYRKKHNFDLIHSFHLVHCLETSDFEWKLVRFSYRLQLSGEFLSLAFVVLRLALKLLCSASRHEENPP